MLTLFSVKFLKYYTGVLEDIKFWSVPSGCMDLE